MTRTGKQNWVVLACTLNICISYHYHVSRDIDNNSDKQKTTECIKYNLNIKLKRERNFHILVNVLSSSTEWSSFILLRRKSSGSATPTTWKRINKLKKWENRTL